VLTQFDDRGQARYKRSPRNCVLHEKDDIDLTAPRLVSLLPDPAAAAGHVGARPVTTPAPACFMQGDVLLSARGGQPPDPDHPPPRADDGGSGRGALLSGRAGASFEQGGTRLDGALLITTPDATC